MSNVDFDDLFNETIGVNFGEEILNEAGDHGARRQLERLYMHLVKFQIQTERQGDSWIDSIYDGRKEMIEANNRSSNAKAVKAEDAEAAYKAAVGKAIKETNKEKDKRKISYDLPEDLQYDIISTVDGIQQAMINRARDKDIADRVVEYRHYKDAKGTLYAKGESHE